MPHRLTQVRSISSGGQVGGREGHMIVTWQASVVCGMVQRKVATSVMSAVSHMTGHMTIPSLLGSAGSD